MIQWYNTISEFNCSRSDKHKLDSGTMYVVYSVCNNLHCHKKSSIKSKLTQTKWCLCFDSWDSGLSDPFVHDSMRHSAIKHMLDSSHPALQFTLPTTAATLLRVDNGNNVDWSNSIDLQILTNITGSSVPSLALNNTLTSLHPHIIIALSQPTKQVRLINLGLRFWQSSVPRYVHYRPVYSLYYLSLGNLSSPEAWPQVQSKQLNEHETSNFLASPPPPAPRRPPLSWSTTILVPWPSPALPWQGQRRTELGLF